jgi:cysteine-rich repeat protein
MKRLVLFAAAGLIVAGCGDDSTVGNTNNNQVLPECGNGVVEEGEICDDGNIIGGDGCSVDCQLEFCGNGDLDDPEVCDDGNTTGGDGCSADCMSNETCGNGVVDSVVGELCDDGNTVDSDGCQANCTLASCGDGILDGGETCDDGNNVGGDGCNALCSSNETCGNSIVDVAAGEQCDDGNTIIGDGCADDCQFEFCGNGTVDASEVCDDSNTLDGDGCAADCMSDETCGNSTVDASEQCDDGNSSDGDGCAADCQFEFCGNGTVDASEVCDDSNMLDGDGCSADCRSDETCGNGTVDASEMCDDSNTIGGDGCSTHCAIEYCGNGVVTEGEFCDDGYNDACGSCNSDCSAAGSGNVCGDGELCPEIEACDDGNTDDENGTDDFCAADCTVHSWPCGEWPGYMPTSYSSCRHNFWNATMNGSSSGYAVVSEGASFPMTISSEYNHCGYCPGCVVQTYLGLMSGPAPAVDDGSLAGCGNGYQYCRAYNSPGTIYNESRTFTAPTEGTYYLRWNASLQMSCGSWGCPNEGNDLFALCVVP